MSSPDSPDSDPLDFLRDEPTLAKPGTGRSAIIRCPHCGRTFPVLPAPLEATEGRIAPTVIEQTGKLWKLTQAIGLVVMFLGLAVFGIAQQRHHMGIMALGAVAAGVGLLIYTVGRLGAWWYHG